MSRPRWVRPHSRPVCFPCLHCLGSRLLCPELSEAGPGLYALPRSKLLRFRHSGSPQRRRLRWACGLCPSQVRAAQVTRCLASGRCDSSPPPSLLPGFLGVQPAHLLRRMVTVQNPKSWLAEKPACSLVDNASLGLLLPPSGPSSSGCLSPEGDGLQPASSVQSFVMCMGLAVSLGFSHGSYPTVWFASPS